MLEISLLRSPVSKNIRVNMAVLQFPGLIAISRRVRETLLQRNKSLNNAICPALHSSGGIWKVPVEDS